MKVWLAEEYEDPYMDPTTASVHTTEEGAKEAVIDLSVGTWWVWEGHRQVCLARKRGYVIVVGAVRAMEVL